ncbi:MAG: hypothetical protein KDJ25_14535 [Rhodoblastus sp.]|nr:hypothetical protein [Rhodoblastus sp.]
MSASTPLAVAVSAATILLVSAQSASASCVVRGTRYDPAQNDSVTWYATVTGGTCRITFRSLGSLVFTGTSVASRPSGGSVAMSGNTTANYRARGGFKGADSVAFKVCGQGRSGSGCSTITVQLTVD